ncbi:MAG: hypothetical protein J6F30_15865 [Cellulosilyticum sp.]|nr:hypothetical protein [Cellulosilyticum sp.]
MKYAAKYLLILSILGISTTSVYGQEGNVPTISIGGSNDHAMQEEQEVEITKNSLETAVEENVEDAKSHTHKITNVAVINLEDGSMTMGEQVKSQGVEVTKENETFFLPVRVLAEHLLKAYVSTEEDGKVLRIRRQDTLVLIKEGEQVADVNGEQVALWYPVYSENGHYKLSAEDLKTLFEIEVVYDEDRNSLTVSGEDRRVNDAPQARFYFAKRYYTAGDEVVAVNTSHDSNQDKIIKTQWSVKSVGVQEPVLAEQLTSIFSKPKAGTYEIGLQVQDERGLWSEWTYEKITIRENKAPIIKTLTTDKETYIPGEPITFNYTYDNEEGEAITNEKWMYRKSTQEEKLAVLGKPNAFFTEGEYIVTLQIDDAYGKRSKVMETTVYIQGKPIRSEFDYVFKEGQIGDRIDNFEGYNYREYQDAVIVEESAVAGTLIMSDSPETVKSLGVLYEDTMEGRGRILVHHLNQVSNEITQGKKQKLGLIVSNDGEEVVTLTLSNESIKGPATDITRVGQRCLFDYLKGTAARTITLAPGEKQWIYTQNWTPNNCISGMLDVETEGKVRFVVAAMTEETTLEEIDKLERLPMDGVHISGTFDTIGLNYTLNLDGSMPTKLLLGDKGSEEWVKGIDVRTGVSVENKGNFGVSYYVTIIAEEDMGIFLNSRGTGIQGAIKWEDGSVYNVPGQGMLAQVSTRAAIIGTIKKGETKTFEYILPNGSSAPILIGFVPDSQF